MVSNRNRVTTIINTISFDEFYPYQLVRKYHEKECKEFMLRQMYVLPNTPKIIIVDKGNGSEEVLLLAQRGQYQIDKVI